VRCLNHDLFAAPAGIFRPARDHHVELRRHDDEALGDVFAHDVLHSTVARADLVGDVDDLSDTRQVRGQRPAVGAALSDASLALGGIGGVSIAKFLASICAASSRPSSNWSMGRLSALRPKR
jgi:hypothetical protein